MSDGQFENMAATSSPPCNSNSGDDDSLQCDISEALRTDKEHTCSSSFVHLHQRLSTGDRKCSCETDMTEVLSKLSKELKKENGWDRTETDFELSDLVGKTVNSDGESSQSASNLVPACSLDAIFGEDGWAQFLRPKPRQWRDKLTLRERLLDPTLDEKTRLRLIRLQLRNDRKSVRKKEAVNCPICDKSVKRNSMSRHIKTHSREKRYKCQVCGNGYDRIDYFEKHMVYHTDEKPHKCEICGKGFKLERKMRKHMLSHSGEKPYICSLCDKGFSDSSALYKHLRAHNGEKPYECSFCGKAFNESTKVVRHMRIHTGEKPFECPICGRAFNDKSSRSKHIKTHEKAKLQIKQEVPDMDFHQPQENGVYDENRLGHHDGSEEDLFDDDRQTESDHSHNDPYDADEVEGEQHREDGDQMESFDVGADSDEEGQLLHEEDGESS